MLASTQTRRQAPPVASSWQQPTELRGVDHLCWTPGQARGRHAQTAPVPVCQLWQRCAPLQLLLLLLLPLGPRPPPVTPEPRCMVQCLADSCHQWQGSTLWMQLCTPLSSTASSQSTPVERRVVLCLHLHRHRKCSPASPPGRQSTPRLHSQLGWPHCGTGSVCSLRSKVTTMTTATAHSHVAVAQGEAQAEARRRRSLT